MGRDWCLLAVAPVLILTPPMVQAQTAEPAIGTWRGAIGPDVASRLDIRADGQFRYILSAGALDEGAEGRWIRDGAVLRLFTEPKPKPPRFVLDMASPESKAGAALFLFVGGPRRSPDTNPAAATYADTEGIAGVDFRIEMDRGDPLTGYTQHDGWVTDSLDGRTPLWVQLAEPINGITSQRIAIPVGARTLRFTLEPNDIGVASFDGAEVTVEPDALTLRHRLGALRYVRDER